MGSLDNFNASLNTTAGVAGKLVISLSSLAQAHGSLNTATQGTSDSTKALVTNVEQLTEKVTEDTTAITASTAAIKADEAAIQGLSKAASMHSSAVTDVARSYQQLSMDQQLAIDGANGVASSIADGTAVAGSATIANLTLAKATDAETASLKALLETYNGYSAAAANALTVASGWNDYLSELKASFDSGALSVIAYKQALEDFQTQLSQEFPGAVGKAKDALTAMMGVLNQLIATAGAGGAGQGIDQSVSGQLNKAFNG